MKSREAEFEPGDLADGMSTLAKISRKEEHCDATFQFLAGYLNHPRVALRRASIIALGELRDPRARAILATMITENDPLSYAVKHALAELDQQTPVVAEEVIQLRKEVRELQKSQEELKKSLEELKSKASRKDEKANGDK